MMANRNVPATPSQEELREQVNIKNVKNSEERETDNLNMNTDTDSLPTVSSAGSVSRGASGSLRSQTKIPGPIALGPSCSSFQMSSRKYTSVLDTTRSGQLSANDSGIQADTSISEPDPTTMSPKTTTLLSCQSEMALKLDEEQTLRELQRVVAEMEAEVALDDKEDGEFGQLGAYNADQTSLSSDVGPARHPEDPCTSELTSGPSKELRAASTAQKDPLVHEVEQDSAHKPTSDKVQDNDATSSHGEETLAASVAQQEPQAIETGLVSEQKSAPDEAQINIEKSEQESPLPGTTPNEVVQDNQKKQTQLENPEPVKDLLQPVPQTSVEKLPQIVLDEPSTVSVETALKQAFANVNQVQKPVSPEEPVDALNGATGGQTVAISQDLLDEPEPENGDLDLATTSEAVLVAQPSTTNSHITGSVGSDRRMIHLEELLRNANNVELLRRLLQIGAESNMVESEPDFATQESSAEDKDVEGESDSIPETSTTTSLATEGSTDEDTELIDNEDEDGTDVISQGYNKTSVSVVWRLLSGKVIHLACPILFCGFAAGLIYMSRKA